MVMRIGNQGNQMLLTARHRSGRAVSGDTSSNADTELQHRTGIAWPGMPPTFAGSVQNCLAVGDDLEGETEWIEDLSQRQFHVTQEGIFDRRRFLLQSLRHRKVSFIVGYRWLQQLPE